MSRLAKRTWSERAAFLVMCVGMVLVWIYLRPNDKSVQVLLLLAFAILVLYGIGASFEPRSRRRK